MGFNTGLGFPIMLGRPYYYMEEGFIPPTGSACDCNSLHGQTGSYIFNGTSSEIRQAYTSGTACAQQTATAWFDANGQDNEISIAMWIKPDDVTSSTLAAKMLDRGGVSRQFVLFFDGSDKLIWRIYDEDTYNSGSGDNYIQIKSDNAQNGLEGGWHLVVATYDGSCAQAGLELYVDGSSLTATKSTNNGYTQAANVNAPLVFGTDFESGFNSGSESNVGGWYDGKMNNMAFWQEELTAGTVTDLWNSGNSYIYQVNPNTTWTGVSDFSYGVHYTDQSTSGAVDECPDLQLYYPAGISSGPHAGTVQDWSCNDCTGGAYNITESSSDYPGAWTPNIAVTGVTEKIRIWLQNNTGITGSPISEWANQATGDTAVDAEQGSATLRPAASGGGADFDGTNDYFRLLDGSGGSYDFDIAAQEGLTVMCVFNRDADGNHTILSSASDDHYLRVDSGSDTITIKLGTTETKIGPSVLDLWTNGTKVLMTLVREAGTTGNLRLYADGVELNQGTQAANPGDGEFNTIAYRSSGTNEFFNGKIYELAMWNKALTTAELLAAHDYFKTIHSIP